MAPSSGRWACAPLIPTGSPGPWPRATLRTTDVARVPCAPIGRATGAIVPVSCGPGMATYAIVPPYGRSCRGTCAIVPPSCGTGMPTCAIVPPYGRSGRGTCAIVPTSCRSGLPTCAIVPPYERSGRGTCAIVPPSFGSGSPTCAIVPPYERCSRGTCAIVPSCVQFGRGPCAIIPASCWPGMADDDARRVPCCGRGPCGWAFPVFFTERYMLLRKTRTRRVPHLTTFPAVAARLASGAPPTCRGPRRG